MGVHALRVCSAQNVGHRLVVIADKLHCCMAVHSVCTRDAALWCMKSDNALHHDRRTNTHCSVLTEPEIILR